jgi:hypothetical protein
MSKFVLETKSAKSIDATCDCKLKRLQKELAFYNRIKK